MPDVEAVNRNEGLALLDDGSVISIDTWQDAVGEECEPEEATFAVAPLPDGKWIWIDLWAFVPVKTN